MESLMVQIESALEANDGAALEAAWYALYEADPAQAMHTLMIMRPLARQS